MMEFLSSPTRNLFFTGKGGVGKTSVACATAVRLADAGKRVLLVSTDPASNLDEVLDTELGSKPTPIAAVPGLCALNIDPARAAAEYRERMVAPYRGVLPDPAVASMEEQFSGSCTLEIAAFDEFSSLLGDAAATEAFDHVIFDTAPTGHTLRLLTLPSAWDGFMDANTTGTSCLGPLAGLQDQRQHYRRSVAALRDPAVTTLVLVTRPEVSAFTEAARTSGELAELQVLNQHLVINGVYRASDLRDPVAAAMQQRADAAMEALPRELATLPRTVVPLSPQPLLGIDALRSVAALSSWEATRSGGAAATIEDGLADFTDDAAGLGLPSDPWADGELDKIQSLRSLVDELESAGRGVVLAMGKGGVGKTTVAAAVAMALAERGHAVHLSTTDPAAHVAAAVAEESLPGLTVTRIDPVAETASYAREVLESAGANLDAAGRALLEEDLRSPCTEEIAVFRAFAKAVAGGEEGFVVLDTAPTGHTILLLDSAQAYHREVTRQSTQMPESVERLLPRLRDPRYTHVLIVTLAEATPVHEAAALQRDLRRAEIEPYAWVINQTLAPLSVSDPLLIARQQNEQRYIAEVCREHAQRVTLVPWQIEPPIGRARLVELVATRCDFRDRLTR